MFGLPIRVAKTTSRDQNEIDRLGKMMETMGSKAWAVLPEESSIELKESSRGDAYNVYDKRIDRANSELSKLVLFVTMTIEDGASLSQSKVHLKVLDNLIYEIADLVRDTVNDQLLPKMVKLGFPLKGLHFDWDEPIDYTPEQQKAFEEMILNNYEVEGSYFEDKYGLPVGERRQNPVTPPVEPPKGNTKDDTDPDQKNGRPGFFD
jgi:phage gp29-like protein